MDEEALFHMHLRASEIMNSSSIKKQLSGRFNIIKKSIDYKVAKKEKQIKIKFVKKITSKKLHQPVQEIERKTIGLCDDFFEVTLEDGAQVIVRINKEKKYMTGLHAYISLFQAQNIKVPETIVEDYSKTNFPYCYQILGKK